MGLSEILSDLGAGIAGLFVEMANTLAQIFFTINTAEGVTTFTITPLGYIALIGLVLSIAYFMFRWISSLFRQRAGR